jgi:hypothetical protein
VPHFKGLRTAAIEVIESSPLSEEDRYSLMEYVQAGEYALAVEFTCGRIAQQELGVSRQFYDIVIAACEDMDIDPGGLEIDEEDIVT